VHRPAWIQETLFAVDKLKAQQYCLPLKIRFASFEKTQTKIVMCQDIQPCLRCSAQNSAALTACIVNEINNIIKKAIMSEFLYSFSAKPPARTGHRASGLGFGSRSTDYWSTLF
jgi:hypothetical protein